MPRLIFCCFLLLSSLAHADAPCPATLNLTARMYVIKAETACTEPDRARGLMFRDQMPDNQGMLFVFREVAPRGFWMKNTLIPLSIAFLDDQGNIIDIHEMQAGSLETTRSAKPVRYALEMNAGWFAKRKLQPGDRIVGIPDNLKPQ